MITWRTDAHDLRPAQLEGGFFEGWPAPPTPETHLRLLRGSQAVVLALEGDEVVGFVTAVGDGVLCAYVPLLEVLPGWRGRGVGQELVRRLLHELRHLYMVDLVCDPELVAFYERFGLRAGTAMMLRRYDRQSGT